MRVLKLFTGFTGMLAILVAIPLSIAGIVLFAVSADGDQTDLPSFELVSSGRALMAEDLDFDDGGQFDERGDGVFVRFVEEVSVTASDDAELFVGVGPSRQVEAFVRGSGRPDVQAFWVVQDQGTTVDVVWETGHGEWAAVIMNADGTPGVEATVDVSLPSWPIRIAAWIVTLLAALAASTGAVLVYFGWRSRHHPEPLPV